MLNSNFMVMTKVFQSSLKYNLLSLILVIALPVPSHAIAIFKPMNQAIASKQIPPVINPVVQPALEPSVDTDPPLLTPEQLEELRRWQEQFRRRREEQLQESGYWQRQQEFRRQQEAFRERQEELREQREEMRQWREDLRLRPNEFRQRYDDYRDYR